MSGQQDSLLDDLRYLRKGPGLTLRRLNNASAVVRACGGRDQPMETVRERLMSALRSLPQGRERAALAAALNADGRGAPLLKQRRQTFAESVGRASYTVAEWEDRALDELALRLLTAYYAGSATPAQLHMPHGGFLMRSLMVTTLIRDRRFVESHQTREVLSLVDGARGFIYGSYSPTQLAECFGCLPRRTRQEPGGTIHELIFPAPLGRGQLQRFSFREVIPPEARELKPPEIDFAGQTFESPTLQYEQAVNFEGEQPEVVWAYDKLSRIERPGEPETLLPRGVARHQFADLYGGLASGIAWQWPPRAS